MPRRCPGRVPDRPRRAGQRDRGYVTRPAPFVDHPIGRGVDAGVPGVGSYSPGDRTVRANRESAPVTKHELTAVAMGRALGEALKAAGVAQAEFARRVGVSQKHLCQVILGNAVASTAQLDYWAYALGYIPLAGSPHRPRPARARACSGGRRAAGTGHVATARRKDTTLVDRKDGTVINRWWPSYREEGRKVPRPVEAVAGIAASELGILLVKLLLSTQPRSKIWATARKRVLLALTADQLTQGIRLYLRHRRRRADAGNASA